uniref:Uncharacterized protein n=1 Tax=Candidatus Kentrum sp. LFY TaxID=2126342 RepID=A0A450UHR4_9GAMM|nr:MAG: hypothetical protein BECKLFY1418B_GA0070995_103111 [Candidatus Kentron sp. LFY]
MAGHPRNPRRESRPLTRIHTCRCCNRNPPWQVRCPNPCHPPKENRYRRLSPCAPATPYPDRWSTDHPPYAAPPRNAEASWKNLPGWFHRYTLAFEITLLFHSPQAERFTIQDIQGKSNMLALRAKTERGWVSAHTPDFPGFLLLRCLYRVESYSLQDRAL